MSGPQQTFGSSATILRAPGSDGERTRAESGPFPPRDYTAARSHDRLLAALSAMGTASTEIAELMRRPDAVEQALADGLAMGPDDLLPLAEDVVEPLIEALQCVIHAIGCPRPLHRISLDLDRFSGGDDD